MQDLEGRGWKFSEGHLFLGGENVKHSVNDITPALMNDALQSINSNSAVGGLGAIEKISFGRMVHIDKDITKGMALLGDRKVNLLFDQNEIDDGAFKNCDNIDGVVFRGSNGRYGISKGCFEGSTVSNIYALGSVSFDKESFKDCSNLQKITFEEETNRPAEDYYVDICESAFENTGLEDVELPCSLDLHEKAFANCKKLTDVAFYCESEPDMREVNIAKNVFAGSAVRSISFDKNTDKISEFEQDDKWLGGVSQSVTINYAGGYTSTYKSPLKEVDTYGDFCDVLTAVRKLFNEKTVQQYGNGKEDTRSASDLNTEMFNMLKEALPEDAGRYVRLVSTLKLNDDRANKLDRIGSLYCGTTKIGSLCRPSKEYIDAHPNGKYMTNYVKFAIRGKDKFVNVELNEAVTEIDKLYASTKEESKPKVDETVEKVRRSESENEFAKAYDKVSKGMAQEELASALSKVDLSVLNDSGNNPEGDRAAIWQLNNRLAGKQGGKGETPSESAKPDDLPKVNKNGGIKIKFDIDTLNKMREGVGMPPIPTTPPGGGSEPNF